MKGFIGRQSPLRFLEIPGLPRLWTPLSRVFPFLNALEVPRSLFRGASQVLEKPSSACRDQGGAHLCQLRSCSKEVRDLIEDRFGDLWAENSILLGCSSVLTASLPAVLWTAGIQICQKRVAHWSIHLRDIITDLLVSLSARLDAWAAGAPFASAQAAIMTQACGKQRVRRWCYLMHSRTNKLRQPRLATHEQDTEAHPKTIDFASNVEKGNYLYLSEKRRRMEHCKCYEIVLDGVPLASKSFDISLTYCEEIDEAGFNVPIETRALKWRKASAGAVISEEDQAQADKSGFKSRPGMKTYDTIRVLNHLVTLNAPSKSMGNFVLPFMEKLQPGFIRFWTGDRWARAPVALGKSAHVASEPQLPPEVLKLLNAGRLLDLEQLDVTWDSASWDVAAEHCMRMHMRLLGDDEDDSFHESWNSSKRAMERSGVYYAALQMWHPYNCNWLPTGRALHKVKKTEGLKEFVALHPNLPLEWAEDGDAFASDAGVAYPSSAPELSALLKHHFTDDSSWLLQGTLYRMTAWYSLMPCARHYDPCFSIWRKWLRWLAAMMLGPGKWAKTLQDAAAKELVGQGLEEGESKGESKDAHKARLKQLKNMFGNSITLSAVLTHNWNFWHMRLALRGLYMFEQEQVFRAKDKKVPAQHLSYSVALACGAGEVFLRDVWAYIATDAGELARLGVKATADAVPQDFSPEYDKQLGPRAQAKISLIIC